MVHLYSNEQFIFLYVIFHIQAVRYCNLYILHAIYIVLVAVELAPMYQGRIEKFAMPMGVVVSTDCSCSLSYCGGCYSSLTI
ncbi:putative membrane protein [Candidatus Ichthyocystis hellenicum]|uniref:Putative membrane protein n=1 Tax=Candidatus Ichthyocystis hellenicum TaxID=1561003 RepID=A0A0S4M3P6_9BURK|nr:putative membrane protein [Candidatus Ichthyocystis hellenicum]